MPSMAQNQYLETQVLTAAPEKLHLMLIDAAIALTERGRQHRRQGEDSQAVQALSRAAAAVSQILTGLDYRAAPDLAGKLSAIYTFVHRSLTEANLQRDEQKLDDVIRVLQIERDTWRQLCAQKFDAQPDGADDKFSAVSPPHAGPTPYAPGPSSDSQGADSLPSAGFSVEA